MLYYLAVALMPYINAMNVFTYHTVRAGGAAVTGFLFCLLVGPWAIRMLRSLKIGQYIKKEHVADLHALHKGKAGTPTMGGSIMLVSTFFSLLLWGRFTNRLLWVSLAVLVVLGGVGFVDDYIKLRRKHNDGLSARAKFMGQILAGLMLGVYLWNNPITVSATFVTMRDVVDWPGLVKSLANAEAGEEGAPVRAIWKRFSPEVRDTLRAAAQEETPTLPQRQALLRGLNALLADRGLFEPARWTADKLSQESLELLSHGTASLKEFDLVRLNRLLIESAFPKLIARSVPNQHTRLGLPGFKDVFIPLGIFYIPFVIFVIVAISNAVNLTDGLDGLAAGASVISIMAYAGIAYVVSRADWSQYLYLTYVPEASELFVFGATLIGTGLGFLWFNSHPAEVFMGDTGSLALGGAIGTLAILTKQELLLPIVGGLFVLEAGSVVIQVASYKMTGRRVFRMAPLHHHFELLGWAETKVTMRFWIIAILFAMMSLSALKLR